MDTISQAFSTPTRNPHQASTRYHPVDERFARILAEDFAIAYALRCSARRHGRGSYRVLREGPPGRSVDRGDRRQGYGRVLARRLLSAGRRGRHRHIGSHRTAPGGRLMVPTVTAYDVIIRVRYSGESTTAKGWIQLEGECRDFWAEASASDRGTTYTIGDEQFWWSEVPWLDSWFEELWMAAASQVGYELDDAINFDAHMTSEKEEQR